MHLTAGLLSLAIIQTFTPFCEAFGPAIWNPTSEGSSRLVRYGSPRRWQASALFDFESEKDNDDNDDEKTMKETNQNEQEIVVFFDATPVANTFRTSPREPTSPPISKWKGQLENSRDPPLTTMRRARLEKEIHLLEQLAHGNDAATELSNLWINERGSHAAQALKIVQTLVQSGLWHQAEQVLVLMIEEEGVHFLAPISLLAQLCAKQGRLGEAKELFGLVLSQKPWYLDSLLGIHEVCKKLDNHKELVKWDRELIPFVENRTNREAWSRRMVSKAKESLARSESVLKGFFDEYYYSHGSEGSVIVEEENSWQ